MTKFDLIKKMLNGSTTMPQHTNMGAPIGPNAKVHYHDGVACTHDHSHGHEGHVHNEDCNHDHEEHVHDENCKHDH